jgi:hypothetical protein
MKITFRKSDGEVVSVDNVNHIDIGNNDKALITCGQANEQAPVWLLRRGDKDFPTYQLTKIDDAQVVQKTI